MITIKAIKLLKKILLPLSFSEVHSYLGHNVLMLDKLPLVLIAKFLKVSCS